VIERRPSSLPRLSLVVAGVVLGLLAAEALVRLLDVAPEVVRVEQGRFRLSSDPRIGYEPIPELELDGELGVFVDYLGKSNRLGFRDREHPRRKEPGVYRVLILGDSVAAGQGVARFEDTFPALFHSGLSARGLRAEVLSFAVTGYNTLQQVATLEQKGLAFSPDLVLVAYCLNDRKRSDGGVLPALVEQARGERSLVRSRLDPRLMHSALYRLARFRLLPDRTPWELPPGDSRAEAFALLTRLSQDGGFRVLVVIFPRFGKLLEYRWAAEHAEVETLVRPHGFEVLDLLSAFQACRRVATEPLGLDRYHPTASGHACAAAAVAEHLARNRLEAVGLLPRRRPGGA
jgi:lysophospholipase L1-like esterase